MLGRWVKGKRVGDGMSGTSPVIIQRITETRQARTPTRLRRATNAIVLNRTLNLTGRTAKSELIALLYFLLPRFRFQNLAIVVPRAKCVPAEVGTSQL